MAFLLHLVIIIGLTLPTALAYNLIFGKGKILHFGPLAVSVASAYGCFVTLQATGSYTLGILMGTALALLLSAFFAWLSFRLTPDGFGILSIAVHLILLSVVLNWTSLTRGALGIPRIPRLPFLETQEAFAIAMVLVGTGWVLGVWLLDRSAFGRKLGALAEQEWHAESLGITRKQVHFWVFLIGGIASVFTNVLFHQYLHLLHPVDLAFPGLIFYIMVVVAGRPGNVLGVTVATTLLVLLREGLRFLPLPLGAIGPVRLILFGIILLGVVWWRRDVLFPKPRSV